MPIAYHMKVMSMGTKRLQPLPEGCYIHFIARAGSGIEALGELDGRTVVIGRKGSGMRHTASRILEHYHMDPDAVAQEGRYFLDLLSDETLDAAIFLQQCSDLSSKLHARMR